MTSEPAIPRGTKNYRATGPAIPSGNAPGSGPKRCGTCGYRRRGPGHDEGDQHRGTVHVHHR